VEEQLPFASVVRTHNVQLTSTLNSIARLGEGPPVVPPVEIPPVQVTDIFCTTDAPISKTILPASQCTLQGRLAFILNNLPPVSQLPRFTATEIEATAVRFEQTIINL